MELIFSAVVLLLGMVGCLDSGAIDAPPVVTLTSPEIGSQFEFGVPIVFRGQIEDDVDPPQQLDVSWSSNIDGVLDVDTTVDDGGLVEMTTSTLSSASHQIDVQVTDSRGNTGTDFAFILVAGLTSFPTISIVSPEKNEVGREGTIFEFLALVDDLEDAPEALSVTFATDGAAGEFCTPQPQETSIVSCTSELAAGLHTLTYTVTDSSGLEGSATRTFSVQPPDDDGDGYGNDVDCDDEDPSIYPGATESCNGIDDDCDGLVDENADVDGDGYTNCAGDCDDGDPSVYPGAPELCNGIDDDCNNVIDEGFDLDQDGVPSCAGDCNDGDSSIYPGAPEVCNGIDDNCDNLSDEGFDGDGDGVTTCVGDCDDNDPDVGILCGPVISAATFEMGCPTGGLFCAADESPRHSVTLSNDFWMGETEVTQDQWDAQIGNSPSVFSACGGDCPVEYVNWYEALAFANALSAAEGRTDCYSLSNCSNSAGNDLECGTVTVTSSSGSVYDCTGYRLPTEAEWEWAASTDTDNWFSGSPFTSSDAWHDGNSGGTTHPVTSLAGNDWGLWDMSGNVSEWTWDWYDSTYYSNSPGTDPEGPSSASRRSRRGGGWNDDDGDCMVDSRDESSPGTRRSYTGLRLVRTIP